LALFVEVPTM